MARAREQSVGESTGLCAKEIQQGVGALLVQMFCRARRSLPSWKAWISEDWGQAKYMGGNLFDESKKGFGKFSTKYIKIPYEHILGIEYYAKGKKFAWSGFHHDFMGKIEKSGLAQFTNKVIGKNGCYKADVIINGIRKEICTFFPQNWTRKQVIAKVLEAYDNFIASGAKNFELTRDGKYFLKNCFTNEAIEIELYITQNGRITSAYPKV